MTTKAKVLKPTGWAALKGAEHRAQIGAHDEATENAAAFVDDLQTLAATFGPALMEATAAEIIAIAAAYNAGYAGDRVRVFVRPAAISARADNGATLIIAFALAEEPPGITIAHRAHGRGHTEPLWFAVHDETLYVADGPRMLAAEDLARHALAPWLESLSPHPTERS